MLPDGRPRLGRPLGSGFRTVLSHVRFGSLADILTSPRHVRFTPNNGRWAAHPSQHLAVWRRLCALLLGRHRKKAAFKTLSTSPPQLTRLPRKWEPGAQSLIHHLSGTRTHPG